jgi:DNA-binding MarR family transcriptional regulator
MPRAEPVPTRPDVGVLAGRLLFAFQGALFQQLADQGHPGLRPRHGVVLAYIDPDGTRASDLALRSGQHKQVVGTTIDELEELGYVVRQPDPSDRRAKLVLPTERGQDQIVKARRIVRQLEQRYRRKVGAERFDEFVETFREVVRIARAE